MLERIHLQNFKASRDVDVRLAPLTILSGLNSSGKSTLLHALGLIRQSYTKEGSSQGIRLSGEFLQLGRYRDAFTRNATTDAISFEITENGLIYDWSFRGERDDNFLKFSKQPGSIPVFTTAPGFQFLQADRIVPQTLYPQAPDSTRESGFLGTRGEYTAGFLSEATRTKYVVPKTRAFPHSGLGLSDDLLEKVSPTDLLLDQVAGWLQQLSPGARVNAENIRGTDDVALRFSYVGETEEPTSDADSYRPTNVGFGLTYSLPVIVACLAARPDSLILLENPEAHLHPQGQSALGRLLAMCANDGVQLIVETHSDHLLNGVRLAVKEKLLRTQDVVLHFFRRSVETGDASVQSPAILETGRLSNWPKGFFDQWERELDALLAEGTPDELFYDLPK